MFMCTAGYKVSGAIEFLKNIIQSKVNQFFTAQFQWEVL